MLKKKYIKKLYIEEAYCDKCGALMRHTGIILDSCPTQYPFECTNPDCNGYQIFLENEVPGILKYEFMEDINV